MYKDPAAWDGTSPCQLETMDTDKQLYFLDGDQLHHHGSTLSHFRRTSNDPVPWSTGNALNPCVPSHLEEFLACIQSTKGFLSPGMGVIWYNTLGKLFQLIQSGWSSKTTRCKLCAGLTFVSWLWVLLVSTSDQGSPNSSILRLKSFLILLLEAGDGGSFTESSRFCETTYLGPWKVMA